MHFRNSKFFKLSACLLVVTSMSLLMLSGCGGRSSGGYYSQNKTAKTEDDDSDKDDAKSDHDLSGEYAYNDNESYHAAIKFYAEGECTVYQDSYDNAWPGTYYWNTSSNSYHVKVEESADNLACSFEFVVDGDRLIVIDGYFKDAIFKKGQLEKYVVNTPQDTLPKHNADVETVGGG